MESRIRPFTSHFGPTLPIPRSPLHTFLLIFTILQWIVSQTTLFALQQCMREERFEVWQQVSVAYPGTDGYDRLGKIKPVIQMISAKLLTLYM